MFRAREAIVRYKTESAPLGKIGNPEDVYKFFKDKVEGETRENFYCLYLDTKNRIICFERIAIGTSTEAVIDPKEIVRTALLTGAEHLILVHNHPSGVCEPSPEDKKLTRDLCSISQMFRMKLLDHIVIGHCQYLSLQERGEI